MSEAIAGTFARDGYAAAFAIGLKPLADPAQWLAPDARLAVNLAEKAKLIEGRRDAVFMARADTLEAQREAGALLAAHLVASFPETYDRRGGVIAVAGIALDVGDPDDCAPLLTMSRLVADDLVLMRRHGDGWRLVAASLCFPSYWTLANKFDRPLATIHAPVPGFATGTRKAMLIERVFNNLKPGTIVARSNFSLHDNGELFCPRPHPAHLLAHDDDLGMLAHLHLRSEDQTLRKLPESGDLLFTIRVATDPLDGIFAHDGLAASLAARLRSLDADGLTYKGLAFGRDVLVDWLETGGSTDADGQ